MTAVLNYPQRIVCLTAETAETLFLLGAADRIAGVTGYAVRPPEVRRKPRIAAFTTAKIDRILELEPDLVLAFSDLQADLTRELIARGLSVFAFNHRSVAGIFDMILTLGRLVDRAAAATLVAESLQGNLDAIAHSATRFARRPRVFFEEWHHPLISGIRWVEELVEVAGGQCLFPELKDQPLANGRIVSAEQVAARDPDVVVASWCGTKVNKQSILSRAGWHDITAVRDGNIFEVKSSLLLAPGPAALSEGVRQLHAIFCRVAGVALPPELMPQERCDPHLQSVPPGKAS